MAIWKRVLFALALAPLFAHADSAVLYNPALGSLPAAQTWSTLSSGTGASQSVANGLLLTDTQTDPGSSQFVIYRSPPAGSAFDTVAGFTLRFDLQIVTEAHQSNNRAGYSVLVQGVDETRALELSFWGNEVWAMAYTQGGADSGFVHGTGAVLDTMVSLREYALTVQNNAYTLRVDGAAVLAGTMTDYPVQGLSTLVYGLGNTLFFGDNSARGQGITALGAIDISPVPEPTAAMLLLVGLGLLVARHRAASA